jgi:hypothetical protein
VKYFSVWRRKLPDALETNARPLSHLVWQTLFLTLVDYTWASKGWFNAVREINFRPEPGAGAQAGRDLVQLWQDSAHKMIDAQAALVRRWTGGISGTKKQG